MKVLEIQDRPIAEPFPKETPSVEDCDQIARFVSAMSGSRSGWCEITVTFNNNRFRFDYSPGGGGYNVRKYRLMQKPVWVKRD